MFPPIESADEDGFLFCGGALTVKRLTEAYRNGIFPWPLPDPDLPVLWFAPPERGVLFLDDFRLSRRTRRAIRSAGYSFKINSNFAAVIRHCAEIERGTPWISPGIQKAYLRLHRRGWAHSVETYQGDQLVGGLYGVSQGKYFCGESMFHFADNASKAALGFLVERLQERGAHWVDCQMVTPIFERLGARLISRDQFMGLLSVALEGGNLFEDAP